MVSPDTLFLFDVDDTLTSCGSVGSRCFARAFEEVYGIPDLSIQWSDYPHVTDWGLCYAAVKQHLGRKLQDRDIADMQDTYNRLLHEALDSGELQVTEVDGASALLSYLRMHGYPIAMATGGWSYSARLKLSQAGIHCDGIPIGSSDIAWSRSSIMLEAIARARSAYGQLGQVVYFGDGAWDVQTCRDLSIPLVGVDITGHKGLQQLGIDHVIKDYLDVPTVMQTVHRVVQSRDPITKNAANVF